MLTHDQYKLYKLIWDRFMASQMASAELDTVIADIECGRIYLPFQRLYRSSFQRLSWRSTRSRRNTIAPNVADTDTPEKSLKHPEDASRATC